MECGRSITSPYTRLCASAGACEGVVSVKDPHVFTLAGVARFERATSDVGDRCSDHLSYTPETCIIVEMA